MIFNVLYQSSQEGKLILISGGLCRWGFRRDEKIIVIYEIISQRPGAGTEMLNMLKQVGGARFIKAKCPQDLEANNWYKKKGFKLEGTEKTRTGKTVNVWVMEIEQEGS